MLVFMAGFNKTFYALSAFFCVYFFIVPMMVAYSVGGINYLGKYYAFGNEEFVFSLSGLIIFVIGFVSFDLCKLFFKSKTTYVKKLNEIEFERFNFLFYFILLTFIFYNIYISFFTNIAELTYAVRQGEVESDHFDFFLSNINSSIKFFLILSLLYFERNKLVILLVVFVVFNLMLQSSGRLTLLINFLLLFLLFFKVKPVYLALSMIPFFIVIIPLVTAMKSLIYLASVGDGITFDLIYKVFFEFDFEAFIQQFSHPFISFLNADKLVGLIGYRFFWDYIQGFLFYFKIIGLDNGLSITYFNTSNLMGIEKSIIPPGYLALGYVQLGFLGVFIAGVTYRFIGDIGRRFYLSFFSSVHKSKVAEFYIAFMCANSFYHGDFRIFVMSLFFPMIFSLILKNMVIKNVK